MAVDNRLTIADLVNYVLQNKRGKAFEGWSVQALVNCFIEKLGTGLAAYTVTPEGQLCGVVVAEIAPEYKVLHISNILTTNKDAFKSLWKHFRSQYPGWRLQGYRHENLKEFDVEKLHKKLIK